MKTIFATAICLLMSVWASASSLDVSVFTNTTLTETGQLDPRSQPCPANLVIKKSGSNLAFFGINFSGTAKDLLFTIPLDSISDIIDTKTQKHFQFGNGDFSGTAYYSLHATNPPFYEVMIYRWEPRLECRYSKM